MPHEQRPQPLGLAPSFGFGDRLGLATPGHLAALLAEGGPIRPIFAQQSIREMTRTRRTPEQVLHAAREALTVAGYSGIWGADADHLKTAADVDLTAAAGFVFFTIDPSDHVDPTADTLDAAALGAKLREVRESALWVDAYVGRRVSLGGTTIEFDQPTVARAAVKYGRAIARAIELGRHIAAVMAQRGAPYEIELSVDETPHPTSLAEHFIVAEQCLAAGMKLVSLAPRYVGQFEKGIDYQGDVAAFAASLSQHAAVARRLGPYKLSLHSGSDKLAIYETFARTTRGQFHVKTAGTSYLEALRAVLRHDAALFRGVVRLARERFETDRATYHISARLQNVPEAEEIGDERTLERVYLDEDAGRQILHVTFGSVLTDAVLGPAIHQLLREHPETHREVLSRHFGRHLAGLVRGLG